MPDQAIWLSAHGVTVIPSPADIRLPLPGDVWHRCFTSPPPPHLNVPESEDRHLDIHWSRVAESLGFLHEGKNHLYISLMGFKSWTLVEVNHDDRIASLISSSPQQPCFIAATSDGQRFLVLRSHEYHYSFSYLPLAEATLPTVIRSPLDSSLFRQSTEGRSAEIYGQITYLPLMWSRPLYFRHLHDGRGEFEFEIIRHLIDHPDVFEDIMKAHVDSPDPLIRYFAYTPMAEAYANLNKLSAEHGADTFLFFAARALRDSFLTAIDLPWLWHSPAAKFALLEMHRRRIVRLGQRSHRS